VPLAINNNQTNKTEYYYYIYNNGWTLDDTIQEDNLPTTPTTYTCTLKFIHTEYKNNITGAVAYDPDDLISSAYYEGANSIPYKWTVYTGAYGNIELELDAGNVGISNLKSSKKKIVQARVVNSEVNKTSDYYTLRKDNKGYYFTSETTGDDVYVPSIDTKVNKSKAKITIRIFGKKAGKSVLSFDIVDVNGAKTGSAKITVVSSKDLPIDSITFAGKSLEQTNIIGAADNKYMYKGKDLYTFASSYTTKKSGKLKVTPNKNYKLVKIQVGTLEKYTWNSSMDPTTYGANNYSTADVTKADYTSIETTESHPVDLNGDGDFDDVIEGVAENSVTYRLKTVKNNKKITLGKLPSYTNKTTNQSTTYNNANSTENWSKQTSKDEAGLENVAPTLIKITLYNKVSKEYEVVEYEIHKRIKKY
jgi:hypothetical protein